MMDVRGHSHARGLACIGAHWPQERKISNAINLLAKRYVCIYIVGQHKNHHAFLVAQALLRA